MFATVDLMQTNAIGAYHAFWYHEYVMAWKNAFAITVPWRCKSQRFPSQPPVTRSCQVFFFVLAERSSRKYGNFRRYIALMCRRCNVIYPDYVDVVKPHCLDFRRASTIDALQIFADRVRPSDLSSF